MSLQKTLGEHAEVRVGDPGSRGLLSPGTGNMVAQLESRIKELKSWLRDTELFIFNLNLRVDTHHQNHASDSTHAQQEPQPNPQHDPQADPESEPLPDPQAAKQLEHFKVRAEERN